MAKCAKCGKEVGCGCNLIDGSCHTCLSKNISVTENATLTNYVQPVSVPANTEFDKILKTQGLSQQEKLKRINDILQKAINDVTSQS